jgi:hypothetical protein
MKPPSADPERANWEVTAIALPCDYIGDFVTVRVSGDWLAQCAWYLKYKSNASKEKFDGIIMGKIDKCVGPDCPKLIEEEFEKK